MPVIVCVLDCDQRTIRTFAGMEFMLITSGMIAPLWPNRLSLGRPLDLTPEQLDQAAEVTSVDVAWARALWQQHSLPRMIDLLDAVVESSEMLNFRETL